MGIPSPIEAMFVLFYLLFGYKIPMRFYFFYSSPFKVFDWSSIVYQVPLDPILARIRFLKRQRVAYTHRRVVIHQPLDGYTKSFQNGTNREYRKQNRVTKGLRGQRACALCCWGDYLFRGEWWGWVVWMGSEHSVVFISVLLLSLIVVVVFWFNWLV